MGLKSIVNAALLGAALLAGAQASAAVLSVAGDVTQIATPGTVTDATPGSNTALIAYFARVGLRFRAILGTRFRPSWAAISRTRAGWSTVSWSQA